MMKTIDLYYYLDTCYPTSLSCEWDHDGVMCLPCERELKKVLITLDVTQEAADYAAKHGFDTILSHHPMLFRPLDALDCRTPIGAKLLSLVQSGISVFSFHTRMDAAENGVNDALAQALGLREVEALETLARIGTLPTPLTLTEFTQKVCQVLSCASCDYTKGTKEEKIRRVALCGGDGKDFLPHALAAGADVYLTGSLSYNTMTDALSLPMALVAAGHYETEQPICDFLAKRLQSQFPDVTFEVFRCNRIFSTSAEK